MIVNRSYAHKCIVQHEAQPYSSHQPISFPIAPQSAIAEHLRELIRFYNGFHPE